MIGGDTGAVDRRDDGDRHRRAPVGLGPDDGDRYRVTVRGQPDAVAETPEDAYGNALLLRLRTG